VRCRSVSFSADGIHRSLGTKRVLCGRSCVGSMSYIFLYHDAFVDTVTGVAQRFSHTTAQSVSGHSLSIRTPVGCASAGNGMSHIHAVSTCLPIPPISPVQYRRCPILAAAGIPDALESCLYGGMLVRVDKVPFL
jgi:hypothetical protein